MLPRMTVEGRLVADPELRFASTGTAVGSFRLVAADRKLNQSTNQWEDGDTLWLKVTCFKKLAENVIESVAKGDLVVVTGKLKTDEWTTDQGEKRSAPALIADTVSVSLAFRTVPHGAGRAERVTTPVADDPWTTGGGATAAAQSDDPPF